MAIASPRRIEDSSRLSIMSFSKGEPNYLDTLNAI